MTEKELKEIETPRLRDLQSNVAGVRRGLKLALDEFSLARGDRDVLKRLQHQFERKFEQIRSELRCRKKLERPAKRSSNGAKKARIRVKKKRLKLSKRMSIERKKKIEQMHRVSGFRQQTARFVQGGAPGLGKKS